MSGIIKYIWFTGGGIYEARSKQGILLHAQQKQEPNDIQSTIKPQDPEHSGVTEKELADQLPSIGSAITYIDPELAL